jgi:hypothetical protein
MDTVTTWSRRGAHGIAVATLVGAALAQPFPARPEADATNSKGKSAAMTNRANQPLSADLVPLIGEPAINMLVVRLARLDPNTAVEDGLAVDLGPVSLSVVDVLSGRAFSRGQTLVVPIKRVRDPAIRTRNPVNQWNTLSMSIGSTS